MLLYVTKKEKNKMLLAFFFFFYYTFLIIFPFNFMNNANFMNSDCDYR
jgi:hypothetical protein